MATDPKPPERPIVREAMDAAWTIVAKANAELRESHPRAYAWARAYIDAGSTKGKR